MKHFITCVTSRYVLTLLPLYFTTIFPLLYDYLNGQSGMQYFMVKISRCSPCE